MGRLNTLDDWLKYQESLHTQTIDLGLERVQSVYHRIFPDDLPFQVITVAGTNGKGSTVAFINHIYQQSTFKVGAFTSPHIIQYNERFTINGEMVDDASICQAFETIEKYRKNTSLTYFEFSTLAALILFANYQVDIAILEVGLGGRLDSVNVVDPNVSVITNIAIDHTDYLGDTREKIGFEKAGIMRKNIPCLCADLDPPNSLQQHANDIGAPLSFVQQPYQDAIGLTGKHQRFNAALAVKAVKKLHNKFPISDKQIATGIATTKLSARFQIKQINHHTVILDVAHNEASVECLASTLKINSEPTLAIFSALKDKNIKRMIEKIQDQIDQWLLVPLFVDRAIKTKDLVEKFNLNSHVTICQDISSAINHALTNNQFKRIVIFGSFHTVCDATKILDEIAPS